MNCLWMRAPLENAAQELAEETAETVIARLNPYSSLLSERASE